MTSFVFRETLMNHILIWGNAYAQIIRDGAGRVLALYPLLPNKVDVQRDEKGERYYVYNRNSEENPNFEEYGSIILKKRRCFIFQDLDLMALLDILQLR